MSWSDPYAQAQDQNRTLADARFLALARQSAEVFWLLKPTGDLAEASASWQIFTGQSSHQALGQGWLKAVHPADHVQLQTMLQQVVREAQTGSCTCNLFQAAGKTHRIQLRAIPVQMNDGKVCEIIMCAKDLTKQAETGQMDEAQIQLALKASQVGMWDRDLRTNQLVWTDQCRALFGLPPGSAITYMRFLAALHPDDRARVALICEQSLANHTEFHTEYRTIWPDGSVHWVAGRAQGIYDAQNKPLRLIGATMDVTDLKQIEEALVESEGRFRRFIESNIIGITFDDLEGNIHEANDAFLTLVGYTRAELEAGQLQWTTLTAPEWRKQNADAVQELQMTGSFSPMETEYISKEGHRVPALVGGTLFHRFDLSNLGMCFIVDLTARKAVELQKDLFLGMTGHELKTPLTALKGTLQLLQRQAGRLNSSVTFRSPEEQGFLHDLAQRLATALRQVDIQTRLINELLDISRITANSLELSLSRDNLVAIVCETLEDLRLIAPERMLVFSPPEEPTIPVLVDRDRISQVLTNYVTNALRYAPAHEPISLGIALREQMVYVWVQDRGPGLSEEAQQHIWQRFHRVKGIPVQQPGSEKGLGLGLYICQMLIAQHGGQVGVQSTPGKGSTFWFTLPLVS
ncbi:MAG TPA: PAS domain-containing protein [Ktedonobacteraceae bacterium]